MLKWEKSVEHGATRQKEKWPKMRFVDGARGHADRWCDRRMCRAQEEMETGDAP